MRWSDCYDWDKSSVTLIIFSAPPELRDRYQRLWNNNLLDVLTDPFGLFVVCLDELWLQANRVIRVVGDEFSRMERVTIPYGK